MTPRRWWWVTLYGVAMGFLEAVVVVYLRVIYYPGGFDFPLALLPARMALIEIGREAATLAMLAAVAALAGRTGRERFAWFCYLFGVWDIVYYAGLKAMLGWPATLMTWDVLFLIPLIWTGPVLAPLLVSAGLIAAALVMLYDEGRRVRIHLQPIDLLLLVTSLLLQLYAFMANHAAVRAGGRPGTFPWLIFLAGVALGLGVGLRARLMNLQSRLPKRYGLR